VEPRELLANRLDDRVGLVIADHERRQELEDRRVVVGVEGEDAAIVEHLRRDHARTLCWELEPHEEPAPAQLEGRPPETRGEALAERLDALQEAGRLDQVEDSRRRRAAELGPAEGRDVDEG